MAVREEAVRLTLIDDDFTTSMAKDAAAVAILRRELDGLSGSGGRASTALKDVDRSGGGNGMARAAADADKLVGRLGVIPAVAVAGTAALTPLAAAAAGVAAAFAAPLAFVGGGLTLFGLLDGAAIIKTNKQLDNIDALRKKLAGLTKGTKTYTETAKQLKAAQDELTPAQRQFAASLDHIHDSFDKLLSGQSGDALLSPVSQALDLAADVLPKAEPIIDAISTSLGGLLPDLSRYSQSPGFTRLVHDVATQVGPDLTIFGHALGDVTKGVAELLDMSGKSLSPSLMHGLGDLTSDFERWASSKQGRQDVEAFVRYFHEVGPEVAHDIEAVAKAGEHLVSALAPLGPGVLRGIELAAAAVSHIDPQALRDLATVTIGLTAFQKFGGFKALSAVSRTSATKSVASGLAGHEVPQNVFVTNWPPGFGGPGGGDTPVTPLPVGPGGVPKVPVGPSLGLYASIIHAAADVVGTYKAAGTTPTPTSASDLAHSSLGRANGLTPQGGVKVEIDYEKLASSLARYGSKSPYAQQLASQLTSRSGNAYSYKGGFGESDMQKAQAALDALNKAMALADANLAKLRATSTGVDALNRNLSKTSQGLDTVGHSAAANFSHAGQDADSFRGKLQQIPGQKKIMIEVEDDASPKIAGIIAGLSHIHDKNFTVTMHTNANLAEAGLASGGTVPGTRLPYGDKTLIWAAPGEEVISNLHGEADRFRADRAAGRIPGYAAGGTVTDSAGDAGLSTGLRGLRGELHRLKQSLHDTTDEFDKQRGVLQQLRSAEAQLQSTVTAGFRSDLFATSGVWGKGPNPIGTLRADIRHARQYRQAIDRLQNRGLSGGALGAITTLSAAQAIGGYNGPELRQYERLFRERNQVSRRAGVDISRGRYEDAIAKQTAVVEAQRHDVHQLTMQQKHANRRLDEIEKHTRQNADKVSKGINGAATNAVRRKRP